MKSPSLLVPLLLPVVCWHFANAIKGWHSSLCQAAVQRAFNCSYEANRQILDAAPPVNQLGFEQLTYRKRIQQCYSAYCNDVTVSWTSQILFGSDDLKKLYTAVITAYNPESEQHPVDWAEAVYRGSWQCANEHLSQLLPYVDSCIGQATPHLRYMTSVPLYEKGFELGDLQLYMFSAFWQFIDAKAAAAALFTAKHHGRCSRPNLIACLKTVNAQQAARALSPLHVNDWTQRQLNQCQAVHSCQLHAFELNPMCARLYDSSNVGLLHSCAMQVLDQHWANTSTQASMLGCMATRTPLRPSAYNHSIAFVDLLSSVEHDLGRELNHNYHRTYDDLDDTLALAFMYRAIDVWALGISQLHLPEHCSYDTLQNDDQLAVAHVLHTAFHSKP